MIERGLENPRETFRKGDLVKLKAAFGDDVSPMLKELVKPGLAYRVIFVEHVVGGVEDTIWLGPENMSQKDVDEFNPQMSPGVLHEPRYENVAPIAESDLRKLLN